VFWVCGVGVGTLRNRGGKTPLQTNGGEHHGIQGGGKMKNGKGNWGLRSNALVGGVEK